MVAKLHVSIGMDAADYRNKTIHQKLYVYVIPQNVETRHIPKNVETRHGASLQRFSLQESYP